MRNTYPVIPKSYLMRETKETEFARAEVSQEEREARQNNAENENKRA